MSHALIKTVYQNGPDLLDEVKALLDDGADPSYVTKHGETAVDGASRHGRFDVVALLLKSGADPAPLGWTDQFHEVAFGAVESLKDLLDRGADLAARDRWDRTPWLLALQVGDVAKAELLLAAGSDLDVHGRCRMTPMAFAIQNSHIHMLQWLIDRGFDLEAVDDSGHTPLMTAAEEGKTECVRLLIRAGADVSKETKGGESAINLANLDIAQLLIAAGEDLKDINDETRATLLGLQHDCPPSATKQDYQTGKHRRFGHANPELAAVAFWRAMVRSGASAYHARELFDDTKLTADPAIWCYQRFGKSITALDDGRFIEIAGEHEDHYDPDFCIYNDVFVHRGNGEFDIYIYPREVFPPTDFHSATLVGQHIYIIGSLGYREDRQPGHTPVCRLDVDSLKIEKVDTRGDGPGWISKHKAASKDGREIVVKGGKIICEIDGKEAYVKNTAEYSLSLDSLEWRCVG